MARAEKSPVRAWVALVTLGVLGMGLGAHASHPGGSHLTTVGPIDPSNGTRTVSLQSSAGGQALAVPVQVRR